MLEWTLLPMVIGKIGSEHSGELSSDWINNAGYGHVI